MSLIISVPYAVAIPAGAGGPMLRESATQDGPSIDVTLHCQWSDRYQLCSDLIGMWELGGTLSTDPFLGLSGTPAISRVPAFHWPEAPNLFCTDILDIVPVAVGQPYQAYNGTIMIGGHLAAVTARFSLPPWTQDGSDWGGQPYTIVKPTISGEVMLLPDSTFFFPDGSPTGTPVGITVPQMEYTWTRVRMPFIPDWVFAAYMGCVNLDSFQLSQTFLAKPGTVLFMPGNPEITGHPQAMFANGFGFPLSYNVEYKFMWRSIPWNNLLPPGGTQFQPVKDNNGNPPYKPIQFTSVFP